MPKKMKMMDGNKCFHVSYAFTEVAGSIHHSFVPYGGDGGRMGGGKPKKHIRTAGQSHRNAVGSGSGGVVRLSCAGALTTTYTASQGLLLMIPNMYKIAGSFYRCFSCQCSGACFPCVVHIRRPPGCYGMQRSRGDHAGLLQMRRSWT